MITKELLHERIPNLAKSFLLIKVLPNLAESFLKGSEVTIHNG